MQAEATQLPFRLTVREVALAAKKAFDEGRLSAQGPTPACEYRDKSGLPCAIGAALPDHVANRSEGCTVEELRSRGTVALSEPAVNALSDLQDAHDDWCHARLGLFGLQPAEAEARFVAVLAALLPAKA